MKKFYGLVYALAVLVFGLNNTSYATKVKALAEDTLYWDIMTEAQRAPVTEMTKTLGEIGGQLRDLASDQIDDISVIYRTNDSKSWEITALSQMPTNITKAYIPLHLISNLPKKMFKTSQERVLTKLKQSGLKENTLTTITKNITERYTELGGLFQNFSQLIIKVKNVGYCISVTNAEERGKLKNVTKKLTANLKKGGFFKEGTEDYTIDYVR